MKVFRKMAAGLLCASLIVSMTGCGGASGTKTTTAAATTKAAAATTKAAAATTKAAAATTKAAAATTKAAAATTAAAKTGTTKAGQLDETPNPNIKANLRVLWPGTSDPEKALAADIQTEMKKIYPNVTVEYMFLSWSDIEKKLAVMIQSGDYPDVMQVQDVTNAVAMGALEPVQPYIEKSKEFSMSNFSKVGIEAKSVNGTLYAVPFSLIPYSHIVNKDLFKQAGVDPSSMKNWDDVKNAVSKIGGLGNGISGYSMANGGEGRFCFRDFMMIALSNGFTPDDTSDASKTKYIQTIQLIKDMSKYMPQSQSTWLYPDLFKAWEAGQVGMMHTGAYFTSNVITNGTKAMDFTQICPMPAGPSSTTGKPVMMVGSNSYAMIAGSKQKEAAWKYIEVAMSEPYLAKMCASLNVPAVDYISDETLNKDATEAYSKYGSDIGKKHMELMKSFKSAADQYGVPMPSILGQPAMEKVVQGALLKVIDGSMTPEAAYDEIKKGIDDVKATQ